MPAPVISLNRDDLDAHLVTLEEHLKELETIASEALALTFGSGGGNRSAGPCAGKSNDINQALSDLCVGMSTVIDKSVVHLKNIRDDITIADEAQGGA